MEEVEGLSPSISTKVEHMFEELSNQQRSACTDAASFLLI